MKYESNLYGEKWHALSNYGLDNYQVSNFGRLRSPRGIINGSVIHGYNTLNARNQGKTINLFVHKLVAEYFTERASDLHRFVIHLDFEKRSNYYENLRYVTKEEMIEHVKLNPNHIGKCVTKGNRKLTDSQVMIIKKLLSNSSNRVIMIAKMFKVTEMQIYRIKSGENWNQINYLR